MATEYPTYRELLLERRDKVLLITLNRPVALNAIGFALHTELAGLFRAIARDDSVSAVILTGAGRAFCAGGDLKDFTDPSDAQLDGLFAEARTLITDMLDLPQPLITAINGPAYGLGATLALFGDIILASDEAVIADTHVVAGVVAGDGGAVIWPWLIGAARAKEFLMTGDALKAQDALRLGLVNHVVPAAELMPRALALAERLARGPKLAIQGTKRSVNQLLRDAANKVLDLSLALEHATFRTEDHREALTAFREKRTPEFKGR